ncbi:MAG: ABC transporter permease [Acetatifactor muris]|nr:ABC transporter permease [Acetatifactor muris]MCM1525829.1 ABC transporter permease [Bacteroides sp.]
MRNKVKNTILMLFDLAKNDFKMKYAGSYLGLLWAFIQPIITVSVYWLVFQYGLRMGSTNDERPYVLWFVTGIVPWFFFSDALSAGTNCLKEYDYLVKKVVFPVRLLPLIKIISSLFVHLVFVVFLIVVYAFYGWAARINVFHLLYYIVCLSMLSLGIVYVTSAVVVFFKDLGQIITVVLQIGMWATPILWDYSTVVPQSLLWIFKLNPMFYIVEGYRNSMLENTGILSHWVQMLYVWLFIAGALFMGNRLYKKLGPHFADVL